MIRDEGKSTISKIITVGIVGFFVAFVWFMSVGRYEIIKDKNNEVQLVGYESYQVISTIKVRNGRTYPVIVLQDENGNYNNYTVQIPEVAERLSQLQGNRIALEVRQSENETFYTFEGSRVTIKKNE